MTHTDIHSETAAPVGPGLSMRVLILTLVFVMIAELLICIPAIARFRVAYLTERMSAAHLALTGVQYVRDELSFEQKRGLLALSGNLGMTCTEPGKQPLTIGPDMPPMIDMAFDLRDAGMFTLMMDAVATLARTHNPVIAVTGYVPADPKSVIEIVLPEDTLRAEMLDYAARIFWLGAGIAVITAALLYASLQWMLVRPIRRLSGAMSSFRTDPYDKSAQSGLTGARTDEVGQAERSLLAMQEDLRKLLKQQERLAAVGVGVTKVMHDLRNTLGAVVLESDRLDKTADPGMKAITTGLDRKLRRAVRLCGSMVAYAAGREPNVSPKPQNISALMGAVEEAARATEGLGVTVKSDLPDTHQINVDTDAIHRVIGNLAVNAREAGAKTLAISAHIAKDSLNVVVTDDGPGMPENARVHLFEPFRGSARDGGTGLGLPNARELVEAHGGLLDLQDTGAQGTCFAITLPLGKV